MNAIILWFGIVFLIWVVAEWARKDCIKKHQRDAWDEFTRTHHPTAR